MPDLATNEVKRGLEGGGRVAAPFPDPQLRASPWGATKTTLGCMAGAWQEWKWLLKECLAII